MFDSLYRAIFVAANRDLDDSAPALILAASTRYLLALPDEKEAAGLLPARLSERVRRLVAGEGAVLWKEHNWIADLPVVDTIRSVTPEMIPRIVQSSFATAHRESRSRVQAPERRQLCHPILPANGHSPQTSRL